MKHTFSVSILPRDGVLDTQGRAVQKVLTEDILKNSESLRETRVGRYVELVFEGSSKETAESQAHLAAQKLLANNLTEKFQVSFLRSET